MKTSENQVKVLGGGLGGILAVLAVMNYLNVMAASVQARRDELATLESIGMTVKQTEKNAPHRRGRLCAFCPSPGR